MNGKQFSWLLIIAIVAGGLGWYLLKNRESDRQSFGQKIGYPILPDFPLNDVTHVVIKNQTNELNLVREEERWRVRERSGYPADFEDIGEFLRDVWQMKAVQSIPVGPSQRPRLEVVEPTEGAKGSGTLVEFKNKDDETVGSLVLGKKHMRQADSSSPFGDTGWPDGRYIRVVGGADEVVVVNEPLSNIEPKPDQWLDKDFFKVAKIRSVDVVYPVQTNSWTLKRETESGDMALVQLMPGEELDTSKTYGVANALSSPSFSDVLPKDADLAEYGLDEPVTVKIDTFEDFTYHLKVGEPTSDDKYPISFAVEAEIPADLPPGPEDETDEDKETRTTEFESKKEELEKKLAKEQNLEGWTYLVSKWTIDPLLKKRGEFLKEPEEETVPTDLGTESSMNDEELIPRIEIPGLPPVPDDLPVPTPARQPALIDIPEPEKQPLPELKIPTNPDPVPDAETSEQPVVSPEPEPEPQPVPVPERETNAGSGADGGDSESADNATEPEPTLESEPESESKSDPQPEPVP